MTGSPEHLLSFLLFRLPEALMPDLWELPHRGRRQDTADNGDGHSGSHSLRSWARDSQALPSTNHYPGALQSSASTPCPYFLLLPLPLLWPLTTRTHSFCSGLGARMREGGSCSTVFLGWEGSGRNGCCTWRLKLDLE